MQLSLGYKTVRPCHAEKEKENGASPGEPWSGTSRSEDLAFLAQSATPGPGDGSVCSVLCTKQVLTRDIGAGVLTPTVLKESFMFPSWYSSHATDLSLISLIF